AGRGRQVQRRRGGRKERFEPLPAIRERRLAQILISFGEQIEEDDRRRSSLREQLDARRGGMNPLLQRVELERAVLYDDDLAVEHAARRQLRAQRVDQLGKVAVERFLVAALNQNFVAVAKHQCAKPVPLRLEDPAVARGQFGETLGEHRQDRRVHGKAHASVYFAQRRGRSINRL